MNFFLIQISSFAEKVTGWLRRRNFSALGAVVLIASVAAVVPVAQAAWPERAITMIVPFPPGGPADSLARAIALKLQERLGQPVVIDNKPGAGGMLGVELGARAKPDGYTMIMAGSSIVLVSAIDPKAMRIDVRKDLQPITIISKLPLLLSANPSAPFSTFKEFVAYAKANPGQLNVASPGNGTGSHLAAELFKSMAGVAMTHIPYRGDAPAMPDVMGGQAQLTFASLPSAIAGAQTNRVRIIAVTSANRVPMLTSTPTVIESGLPGYEVLTWYGVFTTGGTPTAVVNRLAAEIGLVLAQAPVREAISKMGMEAAPSSPEEFSRVVNSDMARWGAVVRSVGIKVD